MVSCKGFAAKPELLALPAFNKAIMPREAGPELKKYMGKRLSIKLNGKRQVVGVLAGYDQFMNLVLDEALEQVSADEQNPLGQVVRPTYYDFLKCICSCIFR